MVYSYEYIAITVISLIKSINKYILNYEVPHTKIVTIFTVHFGYLNAKIEIMFGNIFINFAILEIILDIISNIKQISSLNIPPILTHCVIFITIVHAATLLTSHRPLWFLEALSELNKVVVNMWS